MYRTSIAEEQWLTGADDLPRWSPAHVLDTVANLNHNGLETQQLFTFISQIASSNSVRLWNNRWVKVGQQLTQSRTSEKGSLVGQSYTFSLKNPFNV